jgi:hypothetical protein
MSPGQLARFEAERREHNRLELERIQRQRQERETETLRKRAEKEKLLLEREKETLGDWEEKERVFHLSQAYQKCYLRIREGRGKVLHVLALVTLRISLLEDKDNFENEVLLLEENEFPSSICKGLSDSDRSELDHELQEAFLPYERDREVLRFWDALKVFLTELKASEHKRQSSSLQPVKDEINAIFAGKSHAKLLELQRGIQNKLSTQTDIDTDYWSGLLTELKSVLVLTKMDEIFAELRTKLIKQANDLNVPIKTFKFTDILHGRIRLTEEEKAPLPQSHTQAEQQQHLAQDLAIEQEQQLHQSKVTNWDQSPAALALWEVERARNVGKDELPFNAEAEDIEKPTAWLQKFPQIRARKPRYFNRVRMNYEWNRYNQTHYDTANPPPKIVQGFRFNIFYPDLKDPAKTPNYTRAADPNSPENEIVRFSAGAPYEDLVFRIPKEEWDMSSRHGFKCIFERGALRLHFWLRSQRYRR